MLRARSAIVTLILTLLGFSSSRAATLTVTSLADAGPGSLREAIGTAQPGDTIDFAVTGTILLTSGQLTVTVDLEIDGPGELLLWIDGGRTSRVLEVAAGTTVAIRDVAI